MSQTFEQFDFQNNQSFQEYLKNIYPPPNAVVLVKLQKKWYQKNVDPQFEIPSHEEPSAQEQRQNVNSKSQQQPQGQAQEPQKLPILYTLEGALKVMYFPCLFLIFISGYGFFVNIGSLLISLLAIARMVGRPQFNQQYLMKLLPNEFVGNILYIFSLFGGRGSLVYQMPLMLHFLIGACEFWSRLNGQTYSFIDTVRQNRNIIISSKQKIEVYLFLYSIIGIFIGTSTIIQTIILFQVITLKTKTNANMAAAQHQIKQQYHQVLVQNQAVPGVVRKAFGLIWKGYEKIVSAF